MSDKIKIAICDDAKYICDGFREEFSDFDNFEVIGCAYSAGECVEMMEHTEPDVLLLDIRMETEYAGINIIPKVKEIHPNIKIIMLTSYTDDDYIFAAFANGADDYCEKTMSLDEIADIIVASYNNNGTLRPQIAQKMVKKTLEVQRNQASLLFLYNKLSQLTTGEFELLRELYYGSSYKKISEEKFIEIESVRRMASRILKRVDVKNMKELIAQLRELKFFEFIE
ncbi:MAG: response regulator transcription factor [Clostridiales bacterium]|nr:response regulator transcription factor [Clostridiales bacterium]